MGPGWSVATGLVRPGGRASPTLVCARPTRATTNKHIPIPIMTLQAGPTLLCAAPPGCCWPKAAHGNLCSKLCFKPANLRLATFRLLLAPFQLCACTRHLEPALRTTHATHCPLLCSPFQELLKAGADPNVSDSLGTHVLTIAVLQGMTSAQCPG